MRFRITGHGKMRVNAWIRSNSRENCYIDVQAAKEENLAMIESDFRELNRMLNASGVEAVSDDLMDICELPEEFVTRFLENSYYEYFSVDEGESITVSYITDTEEDYDEHSDSYVYLSIKSDN